MKRRALFCLMIVFLLSFPFPNICYGSTAQEETARQFAEQLEASGAEKLLDNLDGQTKELLQEYGWDQISPQAILEMDSGELFGFLLQIVRGQLQKPVQTLGTLIAIALLAAVTAALKPGDGRNLSKLYETIAVLAAAVVCAGAAVDMIRETIETIQNGSYFMLSFVPVFTGIMTVAGEATSASAYHVAVFALCQMISRTAASVLIPLLYNYLAFCMVAGFSGTLPLDKTADQIKKMVIFVLTLLLTLLLGLLSLQGLVAGQMDQTVGKTTKFLVSSFVPIVGSAVSDALTTVKTCLALLKSCVGTFGIIASVALFLPDVMGCLLWMGTLRVSVLVSQTLGTAKLSKLLSSVYDVYIIVFAILLTIMMLLVITAAIMLLSGGHVK